MFHKEFSKDPNIASQISALLETNGISNGEVEWLSQKDRNGISQVQKILEARTGTDYWSPTPRDKILTEVQISSSILGLGGRVDLMIDHGDNVVSLYDIKTGYGINIDNENFLLKYGDTYGKAIWDNALNRAKLQIMMYALILKSQNPELRFRQLKVLHVVSEAVAEDNSLHTEIDPVPFLEIIEKYYKTEHPDQYKALLTADPKIFDAEHYTTVDPALVGLTTSTQDVAMELKLKIQELQSLVMYDKTFADKRKGVSERKLRIEKLMEQIIAMKKDKSMSLAA